MDWGFRLGVCHSTLSRAWRTARTTGLRTSGEQMRRGFVYRQIHPLSSANDLQKGFRGGYFYGAVLQVKETCFRSGNQLKLHQSTREPTRKPPTDVRSSQDLRSARTTTGPTEPRVYSLPCRLDPAVRRPLTSDIRTFVRRRHHVRTTVGRRPNFQFDQVVKWLTRSERPSKAPQMADEERTPLIYNRIYSRLKARWDTAGMNHTVNSKLTRDAYPPHPAPPCGYRTGCVWGHFCPTVRTF
jgi:hypothetical protein